MDLPFKMHCLGWYFFMTPVGVTNVSSWILQIGAIWISGFTHIDWCFYCYFFMPQHFGESDAKWSSLTSVFFRVVQWFKTTKWWYLMNLLDIDIFCIASTPLCLSNRFEQQKKAHVSDTIRIGWVFLKFSGERVIISYRTGKTGQSSTQTCQMVGGYGTVPWRVCFFLFLDFESLTVTVAKGGFFEE